MPDGKRAQAPGVGDIARYTWLGIILGAIGVVFGFWTAAAYGHAIAEWLGFLIDLVRALFSGIGTAVTDLKNR